MQKGVSCIVRKKGLLQKAGLAAVPHEHVLIVYLPNKDKDGKEFDVEPWETEALRLQGRLFGGATSYPARGSYRKSDSMGRVVEEGVMIESTRTVESFIKEADFKEEAIARVAHFMHRFKKAARQESVAVVVDGEFYYL